MNLGTMITEVQARGFDYLSAARATLMINTACNEIYDYMPWPFLQTTLVSTAPVTVADLGSILSVTDTTNDAPLYYIDARELPFIDPDIDDTGAPQAFWLASQTLKVWPASTTASLNIVYAANPVDLVSNSDVPSIPTRYHDLIIHGAVAQAQLDDDSYDAYQVTRAVFKERLDQMVRNIMGRNLSGPLLMTVTDPKNY